MSRLVAIALVVVLAGCAGAIGDSASDRGPYEVEEPITVGEPSVGDSPSTDEEGSAYAASHLEDGHAVAGLSERGIVHPRTVTTVHRNALEGEPYSISSSLVVVDMNGSITFARDQRLRRGASGDPLHVRERQRGDSPSAFPASTLPGGNGTVVAEHWEDGTAASRLETTGGEVEYGDGLYGELFSSEYHLDSISDVGHGSLVALDDGARVYYVVESRQPSRWAPHLEEEPFGATVVVSEEGIVERIDTLGVIEEDGERYRVQFRWSLAHGDDVAIEEPEWVERATENGSTDTEPPVRTDEPSDVAASPEAEES